MSAKKYQSFEEELADREEQLEAARANRATDPEGWASTATEFAEWRRDIRLLGGRPAGDPLDESASAEVEEGAEQ